MIATEDRLADTLETAVEDLEFRLDMAGVDFEVTTSPNTNQYIIILANGKRHAYVTAELSWDGNPVVFVDIYSVGADGEECWVHGDMEIDDAVPYICKDLRAMASEADK
jgi:hypothetical protein|uniref:Uncharacterized protein n=1 Tax=Siphoviridae sp. ctyg07 TaxID=2825747 RepID=A0A8S5VCR4_9CAUD|nr:MAG TPA: hypothetical protein [Siphoviridae sp. ctyg07]